MRLYFDDQDLDGQLQRTVARTRSGMASPGECLAIAERVTPGDPGTQDDPATPAGITLQVTPDRGEVSTVINVSATGCHPGDQVDVYFGDTAAGRQALVPAPPCQADGRYLMSCNPGAKGILPRIYPCGTTRGMTLSPGAAYSVQARDGADIDSRLVTYRAG